MKDSTAATRALLAAAAEQREVGFDPPLRAALQSHAALPPDARAHVRHEVARAIPDLDEPIGAGMLAVWLGAVVEDGAEPAETTPPLLDAMLRWVARIETAGDDDGPDPEPDSAIVSGVQLLGQALVAHIARSPTLRAEIGERADVIEALERVEHLAVGAAWLGHLLAQRSGTLIVMHAVEPVAVRLRYDNIAHNFHLFTLLQAALADVMPGAGTPDPAIVAAAHGEPTGEGGDEAWWHYGQPTVPAPELSATVWGEMAPDGIATVDGEQVLLLWPPLMASRAWDVGFFGYRLDASLPRVHSVERLDDDAARAWRRRLSLPA